ncbi:hypothetical protein ACGFZP_05270 [Kitasatospora sp. NPDC048239]|uniref:hypothetical protein n=1 Tax=Kitasatospora sp. NPDC048239 TaxID=3364046 RepID=UPI0037237E3F
MTQHLTAAAPLDLDAIQARTVADKELRGAVVTAIVNDATKPRAEGRLDAALDVVEQWTDHCIGPQTRNLLDEIRAALNPEPAPGDPQPPA